jgi:hypothetical protein
MTLKWGDKIKKVLCLVAVLFVLSIGRSYAYKDGDFQVWNTDYEEFKINDRAKLVLEEEFRWGGSAKEFFYQHYDLGAFYDLLGWLNVGGGYRQIYDKVKDEFLPCNEPYLTLTLSGALKGCKIDDRNRIEYNDFDYKDDFWRYRNKLTVKAPWKFTSLEIQPYVSDEIFVVFGGEDDETYMDFGNFGADLNQNRFCAGFDMNIIKNLKVGLYYMLQSFKSGDKWVDANVLGTKIKAAF